MYRIPDPKYSILLVKWVCSRWIKKKLNNSIDIWLHIKFTYLECTIQWFSVYRVMQANHCWKDYAFWFVLTSLSKISWPYILGLISELSILFHWSVYLSSCHYHTILIAVAFSRFGNQEVWVLSRWYFERSFFFPYKSD